jgi:hypothetical protein
MAKLEDLLSAQDLLAYIQQRDYTPNLGETLFPNRKDDVIDLKYIVGANKAPVSASIRAVDAETQIGGRAIDTKTFEHEIFTIARKIPLTEKFILELSRTTNNDALRSFAQLIYDDLDNMVQSVRVRIERMRMDALFNGVLNINENGFVGTVDYQVPADHKKDVSATAPWSASSTDWVSDLDTWVELLRGSGVIATRVLTTSEVLRTILKHSKTKSYIFGTSSSTGYVTENILNDWLVSAGLPTFAAYDNVYAIEKNDGTREQKKYVPYGKIAIFGSDPVGVTQFGLTAEEIELRLDPSYSFGGDNFITGVIEREFDPPRRWTKAVARALPSFGGADGVIQAKVLADPV